MTAFCHEQSSALKCFYHSWLAPLLNKVLSAHRLHTLLKLFKRAVPSPAALPSPLPPPLPPSRRRSRSVPRRRRIASAAAPRPSRPRPRPPRSSRCTRRRTPGREGSTAACRRRGSSGPPTRPESSCSSSSGRGATRRTWCRPGRPTSSVHRLVDCGPPPCCWPGYLLPGKTHAHR